MDHRHSVASAVYIYMHHVAIYMQLESLFLFSVSNHACPDTINAKPSWRPNVETIWSGTRLFNHTNILIEFSHIDCSAL